MVKQIFFALVKFQKSTISWAIQKNETQDVVVVVPKADNIL